MLIKRTERQARRGTLAAALGRPIPAASSIAAASCAAPASPPADSPRVGALPLAQRPQGRSRRIDGDRRRHHPQEHLHALLGRLHRHRRSRQRRLGRPGARLGFADQPRLALRQGRGDPRARARRPPPALPDEARERPMDPHLVGRRDQRDRRQADGDPRASPAPIRSTGSARPSTPTKAPISTASSPRSGAPTTRTTRRASAIPPRSPASPTPGATAR